LIFLPHASSDAGKIAVNAGEIKNFQPTRPVRPVPKVTFFDQADKPRTLAEHRGKGVVLNFWATWCAPCVREMPSLDRLQALVEKDGIVVLPLSIDREGLPVAKRFYEKNELRNLPVLVDKTREALHRLSIRGLPTTVLIDPSGNEIGRVTGENVWDSPETINFLRKHIAGPKSRLRQTRAAPAPQAG